MKGLISGFLLGSISLALYSIIIGVIAPKSPESFNVETIYSSQFSNSETSGSPQNISLDNFNYKNSEISVPKTDRDMNKPLESILLNTPKNSALQNSSYSSALQMSKEMTDNPSQPIIPKVNTDNMIKNNTFLFERRGLLFKALNEVDFYLLIFKHCSIGCCSSYSVRFMHCFHIFSFRITIEYNTATSLYM